MLAQFVMKMPLAGQLVIAIGWFVTGLVSAFAALRVAQGEPALIAARVVTEHPGSYRVLTVLSDAGYNDGEALRWLYTPDDSLPGTPAKALQDSRATEVKRRAQALGF